MKRLLLFGFAPLPFENTFKNFGPGIRSWQFALPAIDAGYEVLLIACRIPFIYEASTPDLVRTQKNQLTYLHVAEHLFRDPEFIQSQHDQFNPDAICATTVFATSPLHHLKTTAPIWIDLFGHVMAEAQAKAYRYNDDKFLSHFWTHELKALLTGDIFSSVSLPQENATIGELGILGRLTKATTGYRFCHTIPCAIDPEPLQHDKNVFRGIEIPESAFVVLWSGGFNTWTDVSTLTAGLDTAMEVIPDLWFVSTGGQIDGHDEITYKEFQKLVRQSRFSDRYLLKGWLPKTEVPNYYFEANIGINIDTFMYEGMFGSKNRVLDWMRAGLPSLIGRLCEISYEFPKMGIAYSFELGNAEDLAEKLIHLTQNREEVRSTGQRAYQYAKSALNFHIVARPFLNWLQSPSHSPDKMPGKNIEKSPLGEFSLDRILCLKKEIELKNNRISELECSLSILQKSISATTIPAITNTTPITSLASADQNPAFTHDPPLFSFIIVSWNGKKYLEECIRSIQHQNYPAVEIIVIDNASNDGSCDLIRTMFPDVKLSCNTKNLGFTRGVNRGIEESTGDIIVLLNQDACLCLEYIDAIREAFVRDRQTMIVGCKVTDFDGITLQHAGGIVHHNGLTNHIGAGEIDQGQYDIDRSCDYVTGAAFAFRKELVERIGFFDPRYSPAYFEELDYCVRTQRIGYKVVYAHRAKILHHESTSTGKFSSRFYYLYHRNRLKFIMKHNNLLSFFKQFAPYEWHWIRKFLPREQIQPLLTAYFAVLPRIVWMVMRPVVRRLH